MEVIDFEEELSPEEFLKEKNGEKNNYNNTKKVYFAFLDVLGFSELFSNKETRDIWANKYQKIFTKYFEIMDSSTAICSAIKAKNSYCGQTSDSLYFYTEEPLVMCEFIRLYAYFSLWAMENDVFFRGGISKGELYLQSEYQYFGDCVINAYCLESGISKYPIVSIDTLAYTGLEETLTSPEYDFLVKSNPKTDRSYINPFAYLDEVVDFGFDGSNIIRFEDVYKLICNNMKKYEYNEKTYSKYLFLKKELDEIKKGKNIATGGDR